MSSRTLDAYVVYTVGVILTVVHSKFYYWDKLKLC